MQRIKDILIWMWWHPFKRLLHLMPIRAAYGLGTILARLVAPLPLPLKKAMERAAAIVLGPGASRADIRAAAREGMFCFLMNEIEVLLFPRFSATDMDAVIPMEGRNHLDTAIAQGNGAILLICHFGANQMLMPGIGFRGYPLYQVSAPATALNEKLPETRPRWLKRTRELRWEHEQALPVHHINGLGNLMEALECLRHGHTLAIAGDGGSFAEPVAIPFFGRTAHFPGGAMKSKRHIAPFYRSRLKSCMLILQSRRCGYAAESQAKVEEGVLLAGAGSQMA